MKNEILTVKEYVITRLPDGSYWIKHESGDGMQVPKEKFEELINRCVPSNFIPD